MEPLARLVSHGLNPAGLALVVLSLWGIWHPESWLSVLIGLLFYVILPAGALLFLFYSGHIDALYPRERHQRDGILLAGLVCYGLAFIIFYLLDVHMVIKAMALSFALATLLVWLINRRWKISIHSAGVGGVVWILMELGGSAWWPGLLALPLVAWARLYLRAHTPLQVLAGLLLGGLTSLIACAHYLK